MDVTWVHHRRSNNYLFVIGVLFYWAASLYLFYQSNVPLEAGDGIMHYQLARFSWQMPANLMHHWGKPVFTILSSPFAQLGFVGMVVFNLLLFSLSAWAVYRLSRFFHLALAGLSPFVLMSSMVNFEMVNAGMTEILMGTLSILGLWLFVLSRYRWAAMVVSLSIVARPESVVVLPAFAILLMSLKQWRAVPFLATGFLLFSALGFLFFEKDLSWVITEDPYPAVSGYGAGSLWHFTRNADLIFGYFLLFTVPGSLVCLLLDRQGSGNLKKSVLFSTLVVMAIFTLHSFLWWQGLKGSLGLIRVLATAIPLAAFSGLYTIHFLIGAFKRKLAPVVFAILLVAFSAFHAIVKSHLPTPSDARIELLGQAATWYRAQHHTGRVSYLAPYFGFKAGLNPEDDEKVLLLWSVDPEDPSKSLSQGDILVWDSQFGPQEGSIPQKSITDNPNLRIKKSLEYQHEDGNFYRVIIAEVR